MESCVGFCEFGVLVFWGFILRCFLFVKLGKELDEF